MHYIKYPIKLPATLISILFHSEPRVQVEFWTQLYETRPGNSIFSFLCDMFVVFAKTHTQLDLEQEFIFSH